MADEGMSKSAKRRAAKKARDAAADEPPAPPEPEVKKEEPAPKAKAKAKPKAAEAEPAPPAAEPKAKAKGKAKAKAEPKAAAEPPPAAKAEAKPKADAKKKADSKAAAKPKAKPKQEEEEAKPVVKEPAKTNDFSYTFEDDGKSGGWEQSTGKSKKQERQLKRAEEKKAEKDAIVKTVGGKVVPGSTAPANLVPGMAGYKAGPAVDQSLMATPEQIAKIMATKAAAPEEKPKELTSVAEIKVPDDKIGIVIGPKGSVINMIKEKTEVTSMTMENNVMRIEGKPDAVAAAHTAVQDLITKGFTQLAYDNFKTDIVKVPSSALPDIIGKEGKTIRPLKEANNVEIIVAGNRGPPGSGPKRTQITVAGKSENVDKVKEILNDIVMYYHHECTHPGVVHEEMEVEEFNYRYIIGKAGSELRHIEKNYHVRVKIPREETPNRNVVVISDPGDSGSTREGKRDVDRAVAYIHNLIAKANEPRGRGAGDKAEDFWGEDDDLTGDPELSRYIYRRN